MVTHSYNYFVNGGPELLKPVTAFLTSPAESAFHLLRAEINSPIQKTQQLRLSTNCCLSVLYLGHESSLWFVLRVVLTLTRIVH